MNFVIIEMFAMQSTIHISRKCSTVKFNTTKESIVHLFYVTIFPEKIKAVVDLAK